MEITLPTEIQTKIETFKDSKATFQDWQTKYQELQTQAQNQIAMAETAEADAVQHSEQLRTLVRDLVRAEAGDKSAATELAGSAEISRSLAAEHRAFADELLAQAEKSRNEGLVLASFCRSDQRAAITGYADFYFDQVIDAIDEQVIKALKLKELSFTIGFSNNYEETNAMGAAFLCMKERLSERLKKYKLDKSSDETLSLLGENFSYAPIKTSELNDTLGVIKAKQKLVKEAS
jgi:cell fate (sporulation/competence/biofilm development) regulator YlbF (YheA/YmcA/DUF963 family)